MKQCSFKTCDRDTFCRGWCRAHYNQQWAGKPLTPIKVNKRFAQPTPDTKICTKCMKVKHLDEFYVRTETGKPQSRCKVCMIIDATERQNQMYALRRAVEAATATNTITTDKESTPIES